VPSVAVGERMDRDETMMQARGNLIGWKIAVFDPKPNVIKKRPDFDWNAVGLDAEIAVRLLVRAGPFSDLAEHALVQFEHETILEQVLDSSPAAAGPTPRP
jgi:hypothetical protein